MAYRTKSITNADYGFEPVVRTALMSTGNTNRAVTLPDAAAVFDKSIPFVIKKTDSGTGVVTISGVGGDTIDGGTAYVLNFQNQSVGLVSDGSNWMVQSEKSFMPSGQFGEGMFIGRNTELITIAAAATTDSVGNLLPANSVILGVVARVTVVIPTAATWSIGDATTAARFGSGIAVAANTTAISVDHNNPANTNAAGPVQDNAAKVRITPNLQPAGATGKVRVTVFYMTFVAPTS